jgi:tetratricopeptide (TPR) repeat protein
MHLPDGPTQRPAQLAASRARVTFFGVFKPRHSHTLRISMPASEDAPPSADICAQIDRLIDQERILDAHALLGKTDRWREWTDPQALLTTARLLNYCGNSHGSHRLVLRAQRLAPNSPDCAYRFALERFSRHGPFECLRWLDACGFVKDADPACERDADFLTLKARALYHFRDFDQAALLIDRALSAFPDRGWFWMEKADFLRAQDRYEEALECSGMALQFSPHRLWAVRTRADLLQLLRRDDEALALLETSVAATQSGSLAIGLASALEEQGLPEAVLTALDTAQNRLPLADPAHRQWIAARRCDALHRLGRNTEALAVAQQADPAKNAYFRRLVERLSAAEPAPRRIHLPVGFIRQHHMTCAPATISAIAGYWENPIDHLQLARDICYDGTPDHAERAWLEAHGWHVREFTVTWDAAVALLDRGCPFLIVTVGVGSGHMQAVIGYDLRLRTLLVRDPYQRAFAEWDADTVLKEQAPHGPRGVVMIPAAEQTRLADLVLPDTELHDQLYAFRRALFLHQREKAAEAAANINRLAPDHASTHRTHRDLSHYDSHPAAALPSVEALNRLFPDHINFQIELVDLFENLGRTHEAREKLEQLGGPKSYLALQRRRALNRLADARLAPSAGRTLRRILRFGPTDPENLRAYANFLWGRGDHGEATAIYRLAATAGDKNEHHWRAWFLACRHQRQENACLSMLRDRFQQWGRASARPARTLCDALDELDRSEAFFSTLQQALAWRPDDGELALYAALKLARHRRIAESNALIEKARGFCAPAAWARASAQLAEMTHDHPRALALWREAAALNPADSEAQDACIRFTRICEGRAAALAAIEKNCAASPNLFSLHRLHLEWLREEPAETALTAVNAYLERNPEDAWLLRERSHILRRLGRHADALNDARRATVIEPRSTASHCVLSRCLRDLHDHAQARASAQDGIRLDIDATHLFDDLLAACTTREEREAAVRFLEAELIRQVSWNGACLDYTRVARGTLEGEALLLSLRRIHAAQSVHWSTGSTVASCLDELGRTSEALPVAQENTRRFPLVPRVWLDLAALHRRANDLAAEIAALEETLRLNPAWSVASRRLSIAQEQQRQPAAAEQTLRRAIAVSPADALNHGWLADLLWRSGRTEEAISAIEEAVRCDPAYDWAWERLHQWSVSVHRESRALPAAEALATARAGETAGWLRLVRLRFQEEFTEANLAALDRASQADPLDTDVYDLRAELLVHHRRLHEAAASCAPAVYAGKIPFRLRGRAAWVKFSSGYTADAIAEMEKILAEVPEYTWGWSLLTEWFAAADRERDALKAAEKWAWLSPHDAVPLGWIGSLQRRDGERRKARETFTRALALHPEYAFAARELLELQLQEPDHAAAEKTIAHIQAHFSPAEHRRAVLQLLCAKRDYPAANATFQNLAGLPDATSYHLHNALEALIKAGQDKAARRILDAKIADPASHPDTPALWLQAQHERSVFLTALSFHRLRPAPQHETPLPSQYIERLAQKRARFHLLALRLLRRKQLREFTEAWGQLGYGLASLNLHRTTIHWLRDWRSRQKGVFPYMLSNLALCLFTVNRPRLATEVVRHALQLSPDGTYTKLTGWLALEAALAGRTADARETLRLAAPPANSTYNHALHSLASILADFQELPDTRERRKHLDDYLDKVESLRARYPGDFTDRALAHHLKRTRLALTRSSGSWVRNLRFKIQSPRAHTGQSLELGWRHLFFGFIALRLLFLFLD